MYFCGSIRGGRNDAELYYKIIEHMKLFGKVLTEHVGSRTMTKEGLVGPDKDLTSAEIHDRDLVWLKECDLVVAEVTVPSLGVGYEIGRALEMGKSILCLFRENTDKKLSAMIEGAEKDDNNLIVKKYVALENALEETTYFIESYIQR